MSTSDAAPSAHEEQDPQEPAPPTHADQPTSDSIPAEPDVLPPTTEPQQPAHQPEAPSILAESAPAPAEDTADPAPVQAPEVDVAQGNADPTEAPADPTPAPPPPATGHDAPVPAETQATPETAETVPETAETVQETEAPAPEAEAPAPEAEAPAPEAEAPAPEAGDKTPEAKAAKAKGKGKKKAGKQTPEILPQDVIRRVGDTNQRALAYVLKPDPQLSRLGRKVLENLITDLPPVTAGALLGPDALARHLVASAASGRYRDLFSLWELFRQRPEDCRRVLAERPQALERARQGLRTAVRLGLGGRADRVAEDIASAEGLIWQWLRHILLAELPAVGMRPAIASALLQREPDVEVPLPKEPSEQWLAEAAEERQSRPLAPPVEALLADNADRLPATVATLVLAHEHWPDRVPALLERVDLSSPDIGSIMAWARDHGHSARLHARVQEHVERSAVEDRATGLARWYEWRERGLEPALPAPLQAPTLEGLDLSRPETAILIAHLRAQGAAIDPQAELERLAASNRQLAEKAYEALICAELEVTLPPELASNPIVRDGSRCPYCLSWTWVRPGHEQRCPQRPAARAGTTELVGSHGQPGDGAGS